MVIETKRLILRRIEERDLPELISGMNNQNIVRGLENVQCPFTEQDAREWLDYCSQEYT